MASLKKSISAVNNQLIVRRFKSPYLGAASIVSRNELNNLRKLSNCLKASQSEDED